MVRGILWLCACALAPIVGKASTATTQESGLVRSLAFVGVNVGRNPTPTTPGESSSTRTASPVACKCDSTAGFRSTLTMLAAFDGAGVGCGAEAG
ncbi:unnamed protein product, partial [Laminaria digitata]